jgi:hypothetical protein
MYYPYFRGKQFELLTIRESSNLFAQVGFCPIIEPVRSDFSGIERALKSIHNSNGKAIVIVNPQCGDLAGSHTVPLDFFHQTGGDGSRVSAGVLLTQGSTLELSLRTYTEYGDFAPVFIHAGFSEPRRLAESLGEPSPHQRHVFIDRLCGKLYQKHFKGTFRVLLRDGFVRRRNADYPPVELFSDLHATYTEEGMDGFGDFLVVGDEFNDGGGPAYAVAIHLTYLDRDQDNVMQIYHFVSDSQDTPKDPAGKFAEALTKMIDTIDQPESKILATSAVAEFRGLHDEGHFPGLGYIKKLSMNHHIETLANYLVPTS